MRNHSVHLLQNCYPLYRKMTSRVCNLVNFKAEEKESSSRWPLRSRSLLLQFQNVFSCSRQSLALTQFPERPNSASEVEQSTGNLSPQKKKYLGNMKQSEQRGFLPRQVPKVTKVIKIKAQCKTSTTDTKHLIQV